MSEHFALLVPGAMPDPVPHQVVSPFDGSPIGSTDRVGPEGVETALATAHRLFRNRDAWLSPARRAAVLDRLAALLREHRDTLALESAREGGKPLVDSLVEADRAINSVRLCVEALRTQHGREVPMNLDAASAGRLAFTTHEPIGVVVAFAAFNHPLNLIAHLVGPAVAAGCPIIVKPAETTPLTCMRFVRLLHEAGLPPEWCQALVTRDLELAGVLAADRRVGFFNFIGNARVGWMLRSRLAPGARCALENGGSAPVIVAADADMDTALPLIAKGGFYHAGQVCVSVQRVFVHASIARVFAERLAEAAARLKVGDPTARETEVGPLIRTRDVTRVASWVENARQGGAEVLCGGQALGERAYAPTVLYDPPADAEVSVFEIFGPVVCIYPYTDLDDAIARANGLPFCFQAAVFTRDLDTALRAARRLDASAVMVNDHTAFRVDWMPFGGFRESGLGTGGIPYTLRDMQVEKLVVVRSKEMGTSG